MAHKLTIAIYSNPELKQWLVNQAHEQSVRLNRYVSVSDLVETILEQYKLEKESINEHDHRGGETPPSGSRTGSGRA